VLAPATARRYVAEHTDADPNSISLLGGGNRRKSRKHWTFLYTARDSGDSKVVHLISRADIVDKRLLSTDNSSSWDLPGAAPQIVIQAPGDVVLIVRDYVQLLSGFPEAGQIPYSTARIYLKQIIKILAQWHARGVFHGDLRPENVAVRGSGIQFVDFFARLPVEELRADSQDYVAPELRGGDRKGSLAGDVYSFARLAVELLRPFRGDLREPRAALLERQFSWLADYCYVAEPTLRPSASEVLDVFFRRQESTEVDAARANFAATEISRFPETSLLSRSTEKLERLARWSELDKYMKINHYRDHAIPTEPVHSVDKSELADGIDSRWWTSVHRLHYGKGIDRDHAERTKTRPSDPALLARDEFYDRHLHASAEIRRQLLEANDFLYTADVVSLLSQRTPGISAAEVTALRHWGRILAVPDHNRWLYPAFQFTAQGLVDPAIATVNDLLRHSSGVPEDEWSTLALWSLPQQALGGSSLRAKLAEPDAVLDRLLVLPEYLEEPPYWFHAPVEFQTMRIVESSMRHSSLSALEGDAGESFWWDNRGEDVVLRWSAETDLGATLDLVRDVVDQRPKGSLGALRTIDGATEICPSQDVLAAAYGQESRIDLLRLDLGQLALVWERAEFRGEPGPVADVTAIFHPSKKSLVEIMLRRTGTRTVRECARVALEGVTLHRTLSA
jgi:serine/threonine protein kinase